jgi:hypothetical protein
MKDIFLILFIVASICLSACQSRMICPAFQSSFIYNDLKREKLFAYFGEDSLPAVQINPQKSKFGIIEAFSKRKKKEKIRVVKMERIYPEKETVDDSLLLALNPVEGEGGDLDSLVNAPPEKNYHYNVEQENYNRLFGKYLYKPPPPEEEEATEEISKQEAVPPGDPATEMSRKERRQARKEAKAKEKEQQEQENLVIPEN